MTRLEVAREAGGIVRVFDSFVHDPDDSGDNCLVARVTAIVDHGITLTVHECNGARRASIHGLSAADAKLLASELNAAAEALARVEA